MNRVARQAKEFKAKNDAAEEKLSTFVDAIRKAKELAEQRYREEQRAKAQLNETQKAKAKLIAALTEQEGILKGLRAEREKWRQG